MLSYNIIQVYEGALPDRLKTCMDSINIPGYGKTLLDKFPDTIDRSKGIRNASDIFRFEHLIANPNDIWMDCDIEQVKPFEFSDNGKGWVSCCWGAIDSWIIAPMGHGDIIQDIYNEAKKQGIGACVGLDFCRVANQNRDKFNLIPVGFFNHLEYHLVEAQNERTTTNPLGSSEV